MDFDVVRNKMIEWVHGKFGCVISTARDIRFAHNCDICNPNRTNNLLLFLTFSFFSIEVGRSSESSAPLPATETRRRSEPRLKRNKATAASPVLAVAAFTAENQDDMDEL